MKTLFEKFSTTSRTTAFVCAGVAASGATIGFHDMTGSWLVSGLFGGGVAAVLGFGWHNVMIAGQHSRHAWNRAALLGAGSLLTAVAIATSGWSLATAIGGKAALAHGQTEILAQHVDALGQAAGAVSNQAGLVNEVRQAAARIELAATEESRSGKGPKYRTSMDAAASFKTLADGMEDELGKAAQIEQDAAQAVSDARAALGDADTFSAALGRVDAATGALAALDVTNAVLQAGIVETGSGGLPSLEPITATLYDSAKGFKPAPVEIPAYTPMTRSEATWNYAGSIVPAWFAALGIDVAPLILLALILILASEPLMRDAAQVRRKVDPEEIRVRDANVIGFKKAGE